MSKKPIRLLVVDDSPTERRLLVTLFNADPEIQVVGEARDGAEALRLADELRPDLITMDVELPRQDGIETTRQVMASFPTPVLIVSGRVDPRDVEVSMQAIRAGALTVLEKPPAPSSPEFDTACRRLIRAVKVYAGVEVVGHRLAQRRKLGDSARALHSAAARTPAAADLVAIAASTGGPAALHAMLKALPADFPAPILVVQHMTPGFLEGMIAWLDQACTLEIGIARSGVVPQPGTVYVAPDDRHLLVDGDRLRLSASLAVGGFRPSASELFRSVAASHGERGIAAVLTGMGEDGVAGLRELARAGGRVLAQDEASSVVFGMPRAAIEAGLADEILPLEDIAPRLRVLASKRRAAGRNKGET